MTQTTSTRSLTCADCGEPFSGSPRVKRCEPCRDEHRRVKVRERMRAWRAAQPKVEHADTVCQDCGITFEHVSSDGRQTKKYCESCRRERVRISVLTSTRKSRALVGPKRRTCLDCPADITGTHARTVRCEPCSKVHSTAAMKAYQKQYRKEHRPRATFTCETCSVPIERNGRSGVAHYCDPCREVAAAEARERANAKQREEYGAVPVTHCFYCGTEYDRPRQRGRAPSRCFNCSRQWHYAYMRARTSQLRGTSSPCTDCQRPVKIKRKGPRRIRCARCARVNQLVTWRKYAGIYGHIRRAKMRGANAEKIVKRDIFDRDGWRCGLCHRKIRKDLKHPHPWSASLDHKIPFGADGHHQKINVQASHLRCNLRKNKRIKNEQLFLFG